MKRVFLAVLAIAMVFSIALGEAYAADAKSSSVKSKNKGFAKKLEAQGLTTCEVCTKGMAEAIKEACVAGTCLALDLGFDAICEAVFWETIVGIPTCPVAGIILNVACESGGGVASILVDIDPLTKKICKKAKICP